jgi:hypothetical protein
MCLYVFICVYMCLYVFICVYMCLYVFILFLIILSILKILFHFFYNNFIQNIDNHYFLL